MVKELFDLAEDAEGKAVTLTAYKKALTDYHDLKTCVPVGTHTAPAALGETGGTD